MWYSRDVRREDLAGRNCAKCCVFPKFCGLAAWESQVLRAGGCGGPAAEDLAKLAPRLRARAIWKSNSLKTDGVGTLLEVDVGIPWHHACARERFGSPNRVFLQGLGPLFEVQSGFKMLFAWHAQEFRHSILITIAKTYRNSEVKCLLNTSYFREVSQNSFSQSGSQSVR